VFSGDAMARSRTLFYAVAMSLFLSETTEPYSLALNLEHIRLRVNVCVAVVL